MKKKAKKEEWNRGREQSWFRFNEWNGRGQARIAAMRSYKRRSREKQMDMVIVSKSRLGAFAFYVGAPYSVEQLKTRYQVESVAKPVQQ